MITFAEFWRAMFSINLILLTVESYIYSIHTSMRRMRAAKQNFIFQTDKSTEILPMLCMRTLVDHENVIFHPASKEDLSSVAIWMARERMQVAALATDISCMMSPAFSMVSNKHSTTDMHLGRTYAYYNLAYRY